MDKHIQYKVVCASDIGEFSRKVEELLNDGWEKVSSINVGPDSSGNASKYICDFIKIVKLERGVTADDASALSNKFIEKYANMSQYTKDLLYVNSIDLQCINGKLFTISGGNVTDGVSPTAVINAIKNSEHVPIDLKEDVVFNDIESLL